VFDGIFAAYEIRGEAPDSLRNMRNSRRLSLGASLSLEHLKIDQTEDSALSTPDIITLEELIRWNTPLH
jgi:hypothetical protein